ncbi:MAG: NAD(P)/FAD-dependent oxidoreductase [Propionibacteriaceae bacterium]|jgi:2,4-dienoyl-CoA reductase-like NADH-dependent reductase (Old Yellow Enzyme family)/thioredoxin reductase|nr:NAD(P)/FAD-dependent oxidoreductase [Propionibacteriaceae bacterium]
MFEALFQPISLGAMTVPNRVVMTAMGNHMALPGGEASDIDVAFYGARAQGGVGLVITECVTVDYEHGKGNFGQMSADDDRFIPGLKRVADAVHAHGSVIAAQIYHPGRQGIAALNGVESMPSASTVECQAVHQPVHEMSQDEIHDIVAKFGAAARRLQQAGFDAVEVHAAHGYLVTQFISPYTNRRTDEYGGSLENRLRFGKEIMAAIREQCGPDFPVIVRVSVDEHMEYVGAPGVGITLDEGIKVCQLFEEYGACCLDVSCGNYETMNTAWEPIGFDEGWKTDAVAAVKAAVGVPVIGVSVIRNPAYAESLVAEGKADLVGSARQFFADPCWAKKAHEGRVAEIRRCISCMYCMETLMEADITHVTVACAINYQGGREQEYGDDALRVDGAGRAVAVIGGGPGGLEAAVVLAKRGFRPVVFEQKPVLGGQLLYAAKPPKKEKMLWLLEYYEAMLAKYGVEVRLGTTPTLADLKALDPYGVIVATGSTPARPAAIPGLDGPNVYTPPQILGGDVVLAGKKVAVIGSGMTGLETAEYLAAQGNEIALFEMLPDIGPGLFFQNLIDIMSRLGAHHPEVHTLHELVGIDGGTATFTTGGETVTYPADAFVISLGVTPNNEFAAAVQAEYPRTVVVGDAVKGGKLEPAISGGYLAAFNL